MSHVTLWFYKHCFLRLPLLLWPLQFYFPKNTAQHSLADSKYKQRAVLTCLLMQYNCNILLTLWAQSLTCRCLGSGDVNCWFEVSWEDWTVEGDMADDSQVLGEKKVQRGNALKLMILDRATLEMSAASSSWRSGKLMVAPSPSLTQGTRHSIVQHALWSAEGSGKLPALASTPRFLTREMHWNVSACTSGCQVPSVMSNSLQPNGL